MKIAKKTTHEDTENVLNVLKKPEELQDALEKFRHEQSKLILQEKLVGIGRLAAGIAHEINNPLGFVMSNFETLEKYVIKFKELLLLYRDLKDSSKDADSNIIASKVEYINNYEKAIKIDYMINDLSELFKDMEEGFERIRKINVDLKHFSYAEQPYDISVYDLNMGIRNTLEIAQIEMKNNIKVEETLGDIPSILANGGEINQAILNIIANAVYSIKECGIKREGLIRIITYYDNKYIFCEITDNGIGIKSTDLGKIFDPFFTTKQIGQGIGLGLSISYEIIVNKHKGEILVNSSPGNGTVFTIKLPV